VGIGGNQYLCGGATNESVIKDIDVYCKTRDVWERVADLDTARNSFGGTAVGKLWCHLLDLSTLCCCSIDKNVFKTLPNLMILNHVDFRGQNLLFGWNFHGFGPDAALHGGL
jgi:hypothetical protein